MKLTFKEMFKFAVKLTLSHGCLILYKMPMTRVCFCKVKAGNGNLVGL